MNEKESGTKGVRPASIRALKCEQSVLSRADGSVIYSQGKTVVMASVYGPLESRLQKELPDRLYVDLIYQPKSGMPGLPMRKHNLNPFNFEPFIGVVERGKEKLIKTTCEHIMLTHLHPRTTVNVTIQEMQDGGGMLAASINAACLAIMDSGLSLQCLVAAVTCLVTHDGSIIVDPTVLQMEEDHAAVLTFAFDNRKQNVILSHCEGRVSRLQLQEALCLSRDASTIIFDFYRHAIKRKFSKEL